ncbi:methylenetetrahydrofolate reductase 1 [Coemansia sp. RSA 1813]|nr:methylenetetrahydrofolate reductase 1 [Coemansia sp. RSA 1646]KAJ1769284.1 methylenetetrahydrofolate reductase 1 [Coemansia sp. RSA 1843]KAJ2088115.1 methylenetetrahydrofolate reductase 1 [Coemansia sp. RSA 986]KAJ2214839.1 methylenetetrahydrofolate reductase 1 [Coemansia sp. RSA 487]KAJ2567848.1 methylenetetrahydrofolate reductase 1 [Coemansia sp. RSA 1813]
MKLVDKLAKRESTFSLEFFPPKTEQGLANLYDRIERLGRLGPGFVAVTWGAGGATAQRTLEVCGACQGVFGLDTVMHLTCTNMDRSKVDEALDGALSAGIRTILALRGDPPRGQEYWTPNDSKFQHAIDLVRYIRERHGDTFSIGVAGYPESHAESEDMEQDFAYFVEKVQAGADFVVSQIVFDADSFIAWERKCRASGISVPIIPGVVPIQSYQSFRRLAFLTKVKVPEALRLALDRVKGNDQAVRDLGVEHAVETIAKLRKGGAVGVHLTTLNLETTVKRVIECAGLLALDAKRLDKGWGADDFPNGRWGDARSPAFGGDASAYGAMMVRFDAAEAHRVWGQPRTLGDVSALFSGYVEGRVQSLPWCDEPLLPESQRIVDELVRVNGLGYWTLASQPPLDGVPSSDPTHGWGPRGGYVYQKAFVECFAPASKFPALLSRLQSAGARITYYAANRQGDFMTSAFSNPKEEGGGQVTALTWGVFPGRSVEQPTQIDKMNFLAWRAEAFQTWREWAAMFPPATEEALFLEQTADGCWLVNVVDNDFKSSDDSALWELFA